MIYGVRNTNYSYCCRYVFCYTISNVLILRMPLPPLLLLPTCCCCCHDNTITPSGDAAKPPAGRGDGDAARVQVRGDLPPANPGPGVHHGPRVQSGADPGDGVDHGERPRVQTDRSDGVLFFASLSQGGRQETYISYLLTVPTRLQVPVRGTPCINGIM